MRLLIADIIITNARVFTSDESKPRANTVAIKGNRIIYVGDDTDIAGFSDAKTKIIDGHNRTLTPGFIDTHVHLLSGATWLGYAELSKARSQDDVQKILHEYADQNSSQ